MRSTVALCVLQITGDDSCFRFVLNKTASVLLDLLSEPPLSWFHFFSGVHKLLADRGRTAGARVQATATKTALFRASSPCPAVLAAARGYHYQPSRALNFQTMRRQAIQLVFKFRTGHSLHLPLQPAARKLSGVGGGGERERWARNGTAWYWHGVVAVEGCAHALLPAAAASSATALPGASRSITARYESNTCKTLAD